MKFRLVRFMQKYLLNPVMKLVHGYLPGTAVLETTGRSSGRPRRVPVGGRLDGQAFWLVSEHGMQSDYVRNITKQPRVRLRVRGRWREGAAELVFDDDARRRAIAINPLNGLGVVAFGTQLLTIRIDLVPASSREAPA